MSQDAAITDRLAIVIGNQDYENAPDLFNAVADAERMAELLGDMGFTVFEGYDLDREGFEQLLRSSILNARDGSEIVFFYAGHGIQIGRRNYLLPRDVAFRSIYDLPVESVTLDRVIELLSAKGDVHVAIIDACRENPFPDTKLAGDLDASLFETRTGFDVLQTPINSLVAFSTTPGMVAYDGQEGGNSPYTAAILDAVSATPDAEITSIFPRVRERVFAETNGLQVPWESSTLVSPFRFLSVEARPQPSVTPVELAQADGVRAVEIAELPDAVTVSVPYDRRIDVEAALGETLGIGELPALSVVDAPGGGALSATLVYSPTLSERRATSEALTLMDTFTLGAGDQQMRVTLQMSVDACDLAAGDALDPAGVGVYRLPNEIPVQAALTACTASVGARPEEPRFVYQLGRAQQAAGDYEAALESFEAAADAGHVRAFNAMARLLTAPQVDRTLFDIPEDRARAYALLEQGVAAADPFAMHLLGRFLLREGETRAEQERGFELLDRAAELGHTYSMNELGIFFLTRDSDHYIPERGLRYLEASAARQDIYGFHNLGFVSLVGLTGGEPEYAAAYDWFVKAAEGGHPRSPTTIGRMIVRGQVEASRAEALRWYDMGLERGDPWGGVNAATMILNGEVSGFTPADALVRAAKAQFLPEDDPAARARSIVGDAAEGDLSRAVQTLLNELGAGVTVDGAIGPATLRAIEGVVSGAGFQMPGNSTRAQLDLLAQVWWSRNPVRSDVF